MSFRSQTGAMPIWLKFVIALAILAVVGIIAIVAVLFNVGKNAVDPKASEEVARQIVVFDGNLPAPWKYALHNPFDEVSMKMVGIVNTQNKTIINLIEFPNPKHQSAGELLESSYPEKQTSGGSGYTVESRGEETVGGEKMPYMRARLPEGKSLEMGFVVLPGGKAIMIQVTEPTGTYDPALAQPLLDHIKGYVAS